jgi:hypothetical protein
MTSDSNDQLRKAQQVLEIHRLVQSIALSKISVALSAYKVATDGSHSNTEPTGSARGYENQALVGMTQIFANSEEFVALVNSISNYRS